MADSTKFYLKRRLYSSKEYPLTYSIYLQNLKHRTAKDTVDFERFGIVLSILFGLILFSSSIFQTHIHMINAFSGPFHLNFAEFIEHVKDFKDESWQSWFYRIEYVQVELGEGNIQNPADTYETIRRFSNPRTRDLHIATYKKLSIPKIYIKLPTRFISHFHAKLPFNFSKFSNQTLNCISTILQTKSGTTKLPKTFIDRFFEIENIENEYAKNATKFNMAILTKCGILIGFLYNLVHEKAFLPEKEYHFSAKDIAFDATRPYFSTVLLYLFSTIIFWLFCQSFYFLLQPKIERLRIKFFEQNGFLSSPTLKINKNLENELWLLNFADEIVDEQLLQLDRLMYRTENKYSKIRIIENFGGELFVILLAVEIDELQNYSRLPIIICPVADIRQITNVGIYIINEKHQTICIKWPLKLSDEGKHGDYAEWLHSELMEISDIYKLHFQKRVKPPNLHIYVREFNLEDELDNDDVTLIQLIFEEQNIREEQFQRNPFRSQDQPASDVFIARFRLQEKNLHTVDTAMQNEHLNCGICFEELNSGQKYSIWPCESQIPHMFHFECMLKLLRTNNQCPFCRQPAE